ncbi:hypothetical protein F511_35830 [Dorcoceras hygrometricum]|uniref:Uncharacterized protein n=1 Tax=Dorcoceras hygrometricum TaxID=472368 RepID=A0A2Z7BP54_9LAMI|nr:hypothetical protein F511_35830 [Dorcoceras hygrometricum]
MSKKKMNSRSLESVAQELVSAMMTSAYLVEKATSSNDDVSSKHDDVKLVYVVSHTVATGVHLRSLGVHTSAACVGGGLQMCCNHQSLLVEPFEVEEGEM